MEKEREKKKTRLPINNRKILLINPPSQAWLLLCKFIIFFLVNCSSIFISFLNSCLFKVRKKDFKGGAITRSWVGDVWLSAKFQLASNFLYQGFF